jgi:hypothetical protein
MNNQSQKSKSKREQNLPWYRQFWPWFIIALPASAVVASFFTLWLAISNPDHLVVDEDEYRQLNSELKAQPPVKKNNKNTTDNPESNPDK